MKLTTYRLALIACGLSLAFGAPIAAHANTIGPNNCSTCYGNSYTMTYFQTATQTGTDQYTINLIIDASGFSGGMNSAYLMAISPNIPGWTAPVVLTEAPGGTGDWSTVAPGGINAGGCDSHGSPDFCNGALSQGSFNEVGTNTPLEFQWTLVDQSLPTGTDGVGLKAQYTDSSGNKVGPLLSEDMTLTPTTVPEPATLWLFGSGLIGLGWLTRRFTQTS